MGILLAVVPDEDEPRDDRLERLAEEEARLRREIQAAQNRLEGVIAMQARLKYGE